MSDKKRCPGCNKVTAFSLCVQCRADVVNARKRRLSRVSYSDDAPPSEAPPSSGTRLATFGGPYGDLSERYFYR